MLRQRYLNYYKGSKIVLTIHKEKSGIAPDFFAVF